MATEITSSAIYKIIGGDCWAVPSDSGNGIYKVCFENTSWTCTCKHGEIQAHRGQDARCKHVAAVQTSIKANSKPAVETSQKGHLHSAQGFSLLR